MLISFFSLCVHLHTLIPQEAFLSKGRLAVIKYAYMHPFEHQLAVTPTPAAVKLIDPGGAAVDLTGSLARDGQWFRLSLRPQKRGDHYLLVEAPPVAEEGEVLRQAAKVILHVQTQVGWNRAVRESLDIVPLTRPYGLVPPCVFRGKVLREGKPCPGCRLDVEKYNPAAPHHLPEQEFITGTVLCDSQGLFTVSFPEPGWWSVTATVRVKNNTQQGASLPHREILTFWIPVGVR